jgi:hypothetical protein
MPIQQERKRFPWAAVCLFLSTTITIAAQQSQQPPPPVDAGPVLHISTREAVLDVIVRDKNRNAVADLTESDFQILDVPKHGDKTPRRILSVRVIDPNKDASRSGANENGFHVSSGAVCALQATTHYQIAIQAAPEPGYHQVLVKSTRPGVTLSYRRRYFVGLMPDQAKPADRKAATEDVALGEAACWHSTYPPTLAVSAHALAAPGGKATRYVVVVKPESLADIGLDDTNKHVQLDFGLCTFDPKGGLLQYMHSISDRQLTAEDAKRAQTRGLPNLLEIPGDQPPAMARLVVRDRVTGNMGIVDVSRPVSLDNAAKELMAPNGNARVFGVITPHENAFCGDVYELSTGVSMLPDFWNLDPVGSIYADKLEVWDQDIYGTEGIPGATHSNLYFGVDYFGEFYVSKPGEYTFDLQADDGAKLEIDNQQLIDDDGLHPVQAKSAHVNLAVGKHTIHLPYFQGTPTRLALVLQVKPPGGSMHMFNMQEFAAPKTMP